MEEAREGAEQRLDKLIIETERLYMRRLVRRDLKTIRGILCDKETMGSYEVALTEKEAKKWLKLQFKSYRRWGFGLWAVILKENGEFIGVCGLTYQTWRMEWRLVIGYVFRLDMRHKGYATEAARACKSYAFDVLNFDEVFSMIRDTNIPSQNVALRNGMTKTDGYERYYKDDYVPFFLYSVKKQPVDPQSEFIPKAGCVN